MTLTELIKKIDAATEIEDDRARLAALQALRADAGQVVNQHFPADLEGIRNALTRGLGADALQILKRLRGKVAA